MTRLGFQGSVKVPCKIRMDYQTVFRDEYLTPVDLVAFAYALNAFQELVGSTDCWCVKKANHPVLKHFTFSNRHRSSFKGRDARVLCLALVDQFRTDEKPIVVRKSCCTSKYCINPNHYFYGTRVDVGLQNQLRAGINLSLNLIDEIRAKRHSDTRYWSYRRLSWHFKVPEKIVARICRRESYDI